MSAVAAQAALASPRAVFSGGTPRRWLRSVPAQAGPVVPLEVGNPLQLTETMRARLRAAVRALLSDPGLAGADDPVRLAAVVLMAKAKVSTDYSTRITAKELGRWIGLKPSRVAHHVLPQLRDRGVLGTKEKVSEAGRMTGLECRVIPMYRAQHGGDRRHVLALSRVELVVLLALIEALFAPGWEHKDGRTTPAGMLADRRGRGAATDRLGLLLMVLSSNAKGWLQLCSGSVDTERGRPAATVARLLGCSPAAGAKVLSRLQERDVLLVDRRETASGLNARSRVRLLPVAKAHGIAVRETREAAHAVFSDLAATASGDHEATGGTVTPVVTGVQGAGEGLEADSADRADAAHLHASHASVVTPVGQVELSGGFSGEGRGGNPSRPDRARVREDGPLRGEQREKSPSVSEKFGRGPVAGAPVRVVDGAGQGRQQRGRVPLPPEDLRAVLAPVDLVWARLERPAARRIVEAAVRGELTTVEGFAGRADAPQVLADRLARRLAEQLRTGGPITDPVGWLLARGLPQRQECGDALCDDRVLLDTGRDCHRCEERREDRRAQRRKVAAGVDAALPHASEGERRAVTAKQLHQDVMARAWAREAEWEQVRARQAAAKARAEAAAAQLPAGQAAPVAPVVVPAPRPVAAPVPAVDDIDQEQELVLEDLTRDQVRDWRVRAMKDPQVVFDHIDRYGETSARRLFTGRLVDQVQRVAGLGHLNLGYIPWGQA
uniref:Putative TRA1 protein n=1 Tax=Streptomyces rochei TaxID=1928 RepID=F2Z8P4_STRRO|nr:putative TRA1 protein [Streptomyces rochei]